MALTGLQIFKLLPNTNCKDCGYPTCLSFAMKLAAGREDLKKCPHASAELVAALGAASLPPIRAVTLGTGDRAVTVGEETVFFRHEKTFVRPPGLFRALGERAVSADATDRCLDEWAKVRIERAGEIFRVDGVTLDESLAPVEAATRAASGAAERGLPVALLAASGDGAREILRPVAAKRPLLVPPPDADLDPFAKLAAELDVPVAVHGADPEALAEAADRAAKLGAKDLLLAPTAEDPKKLHRHLTEIRRAALDRAHPGLAHPVLLRVPAGDVERATLGLCKFASLLLLDDDRGETWLPLWTLRQNIFTDPQKPLQIDPGLYPIGDPDETAPLLVTTNFSLTYFIVSTELEGASVPCRLAVVDAEGMSVLTAWSAGKLGGDLVGKALLSMGVDDRLASHRTVIVPGLVAVISGELEDALPAGWKAISGPQEASDLGAFFRDTWAAIRDGS